MGRFSSSGRGHPPRSWHCLRRELVQCCTSCVRPCVCTRTPQSKLVDELASAMTVIVADANKLAKAHHIPRKPGAEVGREGG